MASRADTTTVLEPVVSTDRTRFKDKVKQQQATMAMTFGGLECFELRLGLVRLRGFGGTQHCVYTAMPAELHVV